MVLVEHDNQYKINWIPVGLSMAGSDGKAHFHLLSRDNEKTETEIGEQL